MPSFTPSNIDGKSSDAQRVDAVSFFNVLTGPELLEVTESHVPEHRERLYPPTVTLSIFTEDGARESQRL